VSETQEERSTRLALRAVDAEIALEAARHDLAKTGDALDRTRLEVDGLRAVLREIARQCAIADDPEHHTLGLVKRIAEQALED